MDICKIYLYISESNDCEKDKLKSLYKDEIVYFRKTPNGRLHSLIDIDRYNYDADDEESDDSANEDETTDLGCGQEGLVKTKRINASEAVKPNYLQREVCVSQSYVTIQSFGGGFYCVCHNCYFKFALEQPNGKHAHVNSHYRRSMDCCNQVLKCKMCDNNLFQIISKEVCVTCNKAEQEKIVNHRIPKEMLGGKSGPTLFFNNE